MTLIERIRLETKPMHEDLDKAMEPRIRSIRSKEDYANLLLAFYGFFKPVYDKIDSHLNTTFLPDYQQRRKPSHILENLSVLGYSSPAEQKADRLPDIIDNAGAFGALYVLEGSTLGGLMIRKMIAEQTGLSDKELSFFAGYGKGTRERWNGFVEAINNFAGTEAEKQTAVATAATTFASFKNWLNEVYF